VYFFLKRKIGTLENCWIEPYRPWSFIGIIGHKWFRLKCCFSTSRSWITNGIWCCILKWVTELIDISIYKSTCILKANYETASRWNQHQWWSSVSFISVNCYKTLLFHAMQLCHCVATMGFVLVVAWLQLLKRCCPKLVWLVKQTAIS